MGRNWLVNFFSFNHRETIGLLLIVIIILMIKVLPSWLYHDDPIEFSVLEKQSIDSFFNQQRPIPPGLSKSSVEWFEFDPNILSVDSLKLLGLKEYLANRIHRYRTSGFSFDKPEDMLRVYNLDTHWFTRARPWIRIKKSKLARVEARYKRSTQNQAKYNHPHRKSSKLSSPIDLSTADSLTLIELRGIGPVLASRIIRYRNALGGFYTTEQILEVYGIDEEKYQSLKSSLKTSSDNVKLLDIRNADVNTLKRHPYIYYKQAKAIINYRRAHPDIALNGSNIDRILALDSAFINKIKPYLP